MPAPDSVGRALLAQKCPRCHQGALFTHSAFNLARFDDMPAACLVCGQVYEPEVGFYWGAMCISYGFSVGIVALTGLLLYFVAGDPAVWVYILAVAAVVLLTPVMFRYARTVLLSFFGGVHYDAALGPPPAQR